MIELPIDEIEVAVRRAVAAPKPVIVTAPTGSGKSTRLPIWLSEGGARVLVIEPRRVACRALATFLAEQRGESVGEVIGYTVRFDDRCGPKTRVHFVTPGVALNLLGADSFDYDHVIVDEFHERGWQVDLAVMLLRRRCEERLVLMSATLDATELVQRIDANVLEAGGRTYPVDISYAGEVVQPTPVDLTVRVARAVKTALQSTDGDILVFLPGKREINDAEQALRSQVGGAELVQVHGSLPPEHMTRALRDRRPGEPRQVFLATNVAETSLTLPNVRAVIDSGLVRMQIHRGGQNALALVPVSRASMDQRAGRAGRVSAGFCLRLWDERWIPSSTTRPEIERVELNDAVLAATRAGVPLDDLADCPWITPPPEFSLERACAHLKAAGIVDGTQALTDYGVRLGELPVSVFEARILHDPPEGLRATVADVVALMQTHGAFLLPAPASVGELRRELFGACTNEVDEALVALRYGDAGKHRLNASALKEARLAATRFRGLLGCARLNAQGDSAAPLATEELARHILGRVPEAAYVLRERAKNKRAFGKGEPWSNGEVEVRIVPWEPHDAERRLIKELPLAGALLDQFWIGEESGTGVNGVGRMLVPCRPRLLAELELGNVDVANITVNHGRVVATVRRELAGVVLDEGEEVLRGKALCEAAAGLILEGRLMKRTDARERIEDAFHLWRILASWHPTDDTLHWDLAEFKSRPVPDEAAWLAERLSVVGVERSDDLALLEGEDVAPDIAALSGVPDWELETLRDDFPRTLRYMDGLYACEVFPASRKVLLKPMDANARRVGPPARGQVPRFRGFKVIFSSASREVVIR